MFEKIKKFKDDWEMKRQEDEVVRLTSPSLKAYNEAFECAKTKTSAKRGALEGAKAGSSGGRFGTGILGSLESGGRNMMAGMANASRNLDQSGGFDMSSFGTGFGAHQSSRKRRRRWIDKKRR